MSDTNGQKDDPAQGGAPNPAASEDQGQTPAARRGARRGGGTAPTGTGDDPGSSEVSREDADGDPKATQVAVDDGAAADPSATARVAQRGEAGYTLRPGDLGYAPPARIAHPTGVVLTREHLGYDEGQQSAVDVHGQVTLAMPAPAVDLVNDNLKPSQQSPAAARVSFAKMVGGMQSWVLDLPHEMTGELAVVVSFFRDLAGRRAALGTAAQLGRSVASDAVDDSVATPPPEYFTLRNAAGQLAAMRQIYENALNLAGGALGSADQRAVEGITAAFARYADGPKHPDEVPRDTTAADEKESAVSA